MSMVSRLFSVGIVLVACSSSSDDAPNGGSGGKGGSANATGTGGNANASGSGGSANAAGSGGTANASGTDGGLPAGATFCVLGMQGCPCDGTLCASGLVCKNGTCCNEATGNCSAPPLTTDGGTGTGGAGGSADSAICMPGVVGPVITDCGYPFKSANPLTSVIFNESEVLRAIEPSGGAPLASIRLFYNDEHALTLGVRHVDVITAAGTTGRDYPVTPLSMNPGHTRYPQTGTNEVFGDYSGLDQSGRPMWPVLYITDITNDPNSRAGDWQEGGTPYNPNAVFGTWKAALRTVDNTAMPADVSITPDADPAKNNWNLGGGDPVPPGLTNQGWGAEVRWDLVLIPGRNYRIQVIVHDGDQNKVGGDTGEACVHYCAGASCPSYSVPCDANGLCPEGNVCVNTCCLPVG